MDKGGGFIMIELIESDVLIELFKLEVYSVDLTVIDPPYL